MLKILLVSNSFKAILNHCRKQGTDDNLMSIYMLNFGNLLGINQNSLIVKTNLNLINDNTIYIGMT